LSSGVASDPKDSKLFCLSSSNLPEPLRQNRLPHRIRRPEGRILPTHQSRSSSFIHLLPVPERKEAKKESKADLLAYPWKRLSQAFKQEMQEEIQMFLLFWSLFFLFWFWIVFLGLGFGLGSLNHVVGSGPLD